VGPERQPCERRRQRGVRGRRRAASVAHRIARRRDDRAGQPGAQLRTVSPARAVADGPACGDRTCRRLRGGLRGPPAQHPHLARLRWRHADRCAGRQARAAVRLLCRPHAVATADPGGTARHLLQGPRADGHHRRNAADRRLPGHGGADAAAGARSRDRLGLTGIIVSPAFGYAGVGFPILGLNAFALFWGGLQPLRWYMAVLFGQAARGLPLYDSARPFAVLAALAVLYTLLAFLRLRAIAASTSPTAPEVEPAAPSAAHRGIGGAFLAEWQRVLAIRGAFLL